LIPMPSLRLVDQPDVLLLDRADADEARRRVGLPAGDLSERAGVDLVAREVQLELCLDG